MKITIIITSIMLSNFIIAQKDSVCTKIRVYNNKDFVTKSDDCDSIPLASMLIENSRVVFYLEKYTSHKIVDLFILDTENKDIKNEVLEEISLQTNIDQLRLWYPKVKNAELWQLQNLRRLKNLQLVMRLNYIPVSIFQIESASYLDIFLRRSTKIKIPENYIGQIDSLRTNIKMTPNNINEVLKLKLNTLIIEEVSGISKSFSKFSNIQIVRICGRLSIRELRLLKKLIPNVDYIEM